MCFFIISICDNAQDGTASENSGALECGGDFQAFLIPHQILFFPSFFVRNKKKLFSFFKSFFFGSILKVIFASDSITKENI